MSTAHIISVTIYLIGIYLLGKTDRFFQKIPHKEFIGFLTILRRVLQVVLIVLLMTNMLSYAGIDIGSIIASIGLTSFAVGLAIKDVISNIFSGLSLIFYKPFQIGTNVIIDQFEGTIEKIDLRYTTIRLKEKGQILLFPNSLLLNSKIRIITQPKDSMDNLQKDTSVTSL